MAEDERVDFTGIYMDEKTISRVEDVLRSGRYVKGDVVREFETAFAEFCGVEHAVGVNSGTSAIRLALEATGIGRNDQVFVPAHTFFATVSPVLALDAEPVFVDIDPATYTMDPADLRTKAARAERPAGVVPVHLYGQPVDVDAITAVAEEHDMMVVEDACQAHAATYGGARTGSFGDAGCFSFYPSKNMTVAGDGGMLTTDDDEVATVARQLRNHGRDSEGVHRRLGLNYRLDEVNGAVGLEQLDHVEAWGARRREAARRYTHQLSSVEEVVTPAERDDATHVYHLYVIRTEDRDGLQDHLESAGIDTGIHYPVPVHRQPAVIDRVDDVEAVNRTERVCERILSLPMHPRITDREIDRVVDEIAGYF